MFIVGFGQMNARTIHIQQNANIHHDFAFDSSIRFFFLLLYQSQIHITCFGAQIKRILAQYDKSNREIFKFQHKYQKIFQHMGKKILGIVYGGQ